MGASSKVLLLLLLVTCVLSLLVVTFLAGISRRTISQTAPGPAVVGKWDPLMNWPYVAVHLVQLHTGEFLFWQGWGVENPTPATLWNPQTNNFTTVPVNSALFCAGQSQLADGRIVAMGGHQGSGQGIKDVQIFNPSTRSWQRAQDMQFARWYPSVTTLADGRAIALNGTDEQVRWVYAVEIFNPASNSVSRLGVNTTGLEEGPYPYPFLLSNGKLGVYGAATGKLWTLNLGNLVWRNVGATGLTKGSIAVYRPGRVLATGGGPKSGEPSVRTSFVTNMNLDQPTVRQVAQMNFPRYNHNLVVLADGTVLAVGGTDIVENVPARQRGILKAELWNPSTEKWSVMAEMADPRMYHSTALLLPDGRVLSAGGGHLPYDKYPTAQIFSPPYLFKGTRPVIESAPNTLSYNSTITVNTQQVADISKVSLVRLASVTHRYNFDQRYLELSFTKGTNQLKVTTPVNGNTAPPGYYMLFILNSKGVPSTAKIVRIAGAPATAVPSTQAPSSSPTSSTPSTSRDIIDTNE